MSQNMFLAKLITQVVLPTDIAFELTRSNNLLSRVNNNAFLKMFRCSTKISVVSGIMATSKTALIMSRPTS